MSKEAKLGAIEIENKALELIKKEGGKISLEDYKQLLSQKLGLLNPNLLIQKLSGSETERLTVSDDAVEIHSKIVETNEVSSEQT